MHELHYALRVFVRRPLLTMVVITTLSIGLGAAIAAFAVVDRVVLRKPALADPDRLVLISEIAREEPDVQRLVSPADFFDLRASGAFVSAAAWMPWNFNLTGEGTPERLRGALVSEEFFPTLLRRSGGGVWISDALSRRVAGRTITLGGETFAIAGVAPRGFVFPDRETDVWMPIVWGTHFQRDDREGGNLRVVARLRGGVTVDEANATAAMVIARVHEGRTARAALLHDEQTRALRPTLFAVLAAAAGMLVIACASVVNLMLMLAASRRRELATRIALGGGVLRQSLAEGLVLGIGAGVGSIALAALALRGLASLPLRIAPVVLDARILAIAALAALTTGVIAALFPAMLVARRAWLPITGSGGRLRNALVVLQVALACTLLVSAGVLAKSFARLMSERPGFDPRNVLTARIGLPGAYDTSAKQRVFFDTLLERLRHAPGVRAAATIQDLPLRGNAMTFRLALDNGEEASGAYRVVSDGYFDAMRIPILRGRGFTRADDVRAPHVFVINSALARRAFAGVDPIGRRIRVGGDGDNQMTWGTVAGIAGDVKQMGLDAGEVPALYEPAAQKTFDWLRWTTIVLRTDGTMPNLRREVMAVDPNQPVSDVALLDAVLEETVVKQKLSAGIVAALGAIAFVVALIGVAGVLSYAVTLRSRELGVRIALGAAPFELVRLVLRDGGRLVVPGVLAGFAIAVSLSPVLDRLLFRVAALDGSVYASVAGAVLIAATAASLFPARRAARIDAARMLAAE